MLAAGAAVVALVAIGVVLAVVLSGGSSGVSASTLPTNGSIQAGLPEAAAVHTMFAGIPQSGLTLGSPSAPVKMIEYIDLQCPYCQQFETQVFPDLVTKYIRTGKMSVEARTLDFIGPASSLGRKAMIAAGRQNKAFNFAELLYDNQGTENTGWLDDAMVARAAESIPGLDPRQLWHDRTSSDVAQQASTIDSQQSKDGVTSTPTIYVGKAGATPKQVTLSSPTDKQSVVQAIDAALGS